MATCCDVTVITAAYNCEKYLEECVRSVQEQTLPPREHIIVDDCSTDGTYALALRLAAELTTVPIRLLQMHQNSGAPMARNAAIEAAKTEFLGVMDSDDTSLPGWLAAVVPVMQSSPDLVAVGGGCVLMTEAGESTGLVCVVSPCGDLTAETRRCLNYPIHHPGALLRASAVRSVGGYESRLRSTHDADLYIGLACEGRILNIGEPLSMYRRQRDSVSRRTPQYREAMRDYFAAKRAMLAAGHSVDEVRTALVDHLARIQLTPRSQPYSDGEYEFNIGYAFVRGRRRIRAAGSFFRAARHRYRPVLSVAMATGALLALLPLGLDLTRPVRSALNRRRKATRDVL